MGEKDQKPQLVGDILSRQIHSLRWERKLREMKVFDLWERIVGPGIAAHATPVDVSKKRLAIAVESAAWSQQLSFLKREILGKIEALLGPGVIEDIYLTGGKPETAASSTADSGQPPSAPLDDGAAQAIEEVVSGIEDEEVRLALRELLVAASCRKLPSR